MKNARLTAATVLSICALLIGLFWFSPGCKSFEASAVTTQLTNIVQQAQIAAAQAAAAYTAYTNIQTQIDQIRKERSAPRSEPPEGVYGAPNILAVGDSWAAGFTEATGRDDGWPAILGLPFILRQGRDGSTARQWSDDTGGWLDLACHTPCETCVISLMGNDAINAYNRNSLTEAEVRASASAMSNVVARLQTAHGATNVWVLCYANPKPGDWKAAIATMGINSAVVWACPAGTRFLWTSDALTNSACWNGGIHPTLYGQRVLAEFIKSRTAGEK